MQDIGDGVDIIWTSPSNCDVFASIHLFCICPDLTLHLWCICPDPTLYLWCICHDPQHCIWPNPMLHSLSICPDLMMYLPFDNIVFDSIQCYIRYVFVPILWCICPNPAFFSLLAAIRSRPSLVRERGEKRSRRGKKVPQEARSAVSGLASGPRITA